MQDTARAARRVCTGAQKARERAAREHAVQIANMPPKAPVPKVAVPSEQAAVALSDMEEVRQTNNISTAPFILNTNNTP